jgi:hypothetical protein
MMMIGGDKSTSAANLASGSDADKLKPRPMGNHQSGAQSIWSTMARGRAMDTGNLASVLSG